jgi:hypothetical protein
MHLVTQEIVGKKIDQAIELNTMKEGALVLITTGSDQYTKRSIPCTTHPN